MFTLALDCSTARGSVALGQGADARNARVVWSADFSAGRGCGGEMFTALQTALQQLGSSQAHSCLSEIIVGLGPGSYSGVRQAIAAATGLAAGTGAILHGVPSVAALPVGAAPHHVVGDARRGTFYYTAVSGGICLTGPELLASASQLADRLTAQPGWPVYAVESALPDSAVPGAAVAFPTAARLLAVPPSARQLPPLEPIYLRPVSITLPTPRPSVAAP